MTFDRPGRAIAVFAGVVLGVTFLIALVAAWVRLGRQDAHPAPGATETAAVSSPVVEERTGRTVEAKPDPGGVVPSSAPPEAEPAAPAPSEREPAAPTEPRSRSEPTTGESRPIGAPAASGEVPTAFGTRRLSSSLFGRRDRVTVTGIHGEVCDPGTSVPGPGLAVVVRDGAGEESTSAITSADGRYSMGLVPGGRYKPVAVITASGERISVEQDGPGFRIAEGVDLEVNVCPGRDLPEAAAGATPAPGSAIGPDASAFFGTVYSPTAPGRPAAGYHAVFADAITGVELRSEPTGPDGRYVLAVLPGTRYVPVAAEGSDGIRYVLDEGIGGFRLAAGQRLEFNFVSYR